MNGDYQFEQSVLLVKNARAEAMRYVYAHLGKMADRIPYRPGEVHRFVADEMTNHVKQLAEREGIDTSDWDKEAR